jgi:hypothetical protein
MHFLYGFLAGCGWALGAWYASVLLMWTVLAFVRRVATLARRRLCPFFLEQTQTLMRAPRKIEWKRSLRGARRRHAFIDGVVCSFGQLVTSWEPSEVPMVDDPSTCPVCFRRVRD